MAADDSCRVVDFFLLAICTYEVASKQYAAATTTATINTEHDPTTPVGGWEGDRRRTTADFTKAHGCEW